MHSEYLAAELQHPGKTNSARDHRSTDPPIIKFSDLYSGTFSAYNWGLIYISLFLHCHFEILILKHFQHISSLHLSQNILSNIYQSSIQIENSLDGYLSDLYTFDANRQFQNVSLTSRRRSWRCDDTVTYADCVCSE